MEHSTFEVFELESERVHFLKSLIQTEFDKFQGEDFVIGLSGGSLPDFFCQVASQLNVDWARVKFIFCDERMLPEDDPESTFGVYKTKLIGKVAGIEESNFLTVNTSLSVTDAASDYEKKLKVLDKGSPFPKFEVLLLGMGPDGHTCSLFPGHPLLEEKNCVVAPISDSPKPPPERVTLTFPVLNNASNVVFVATGASKKEILRKIKSNDGFEYPAARVKLESSKIVWILDFAAGEGL